MTPAKPLMLRTCRPDGSSSHGFKWPLKVGARVKCDDWDPVAECGHGLHGLVNGVGNSALLDHCDDSVWVVWQPTGKLVELGGKAKAPRGVVKFVGTRDEAVAFLDANGCSELPVVCAQRTAGDYGTATAGYSGTATAGYSGTATAGDSGTATAGYYGTATAGYRGTATAGEKGTILIAYYDEQNDRLRRVLGDIGEALDKNGKPLAPGQAYRLNAAHQFDPVNA